jgi:hypothetical protein
MKRKLQPTAEVMRQQLALAADEIIRLRGAYISSDERNTKADNVAVVIYFTAGVVFGAGFMLFLWLQP